MAGPGAVGALARRTRLADPVTGARTRLLTREFVLRAIVLMTLMPDADYTEVMTALAGDLAAVPWATAWHVPSPRVFSGWRRAVGPGSLEDLQDAVLRSAVAEHREHDYRAVLVGDLRAGSADGTLTRMPDTAANRAAFGSAGTSDDSGPYPQLRALLLTDASTRTTLGAVHGPSGGDKADGEQKLLDKAMDEFPHLFTSDRIWIMDRNFPGAERISRLIGCTHVLIRVKSDIRLAPAGEFLPDGSYLADIAGGGVTVRVRVVEYWVEVEGQDVPELFCLITDLHDHEAYPADVLAAAYKWRWDGSETALRENKSTLAGAGPSPGRCSGPEPRTSSGRSTPRGSPARADPRPGQGRCPPGGPGRQGPTRRAARPIPRDLLHRRPPGRHQRRQAGNCNGQPAPPRRHQRLPGRDRRHRPVPGHRRPRPASRPQDQSPPAVREGPPRHAHPDRRGHHHRLRPAA